MNRRETNTADRDLLVAMALALALMILSLVVRLAPWLAALRLLALPLVFVLPGYALMELGHLRRALDLPTRLVLIVGLSLATTALSGLFLNLLPGGLNATSWALWLGVLSLGVCMLALLRRHGRPLVATRQGMLAAGALCSGVANAIRGRDRLVAPLRARLTPMALRRSLFWLLALAVCGGAIVFARASAAQQPAPGFTQLWMLPPHTSNGAEVITVGFANQEHATTAYTLELSVDGKLTEQWNAIILRPTQQWQTTVTLPKSTGKGQRHVVVALYRANAPQVVYRHVEVWVGP